MRSRSAALKSAKACAWPRVASLACCSRPSRIERLAGDSRPSHMIALRNLRLVEGNGRRYSDAEARLPPQPIRIVDRFDHEFGARRNIDADANQSAREQQAERRLSRFTRRHIGAFAIRSVIGPEDGIEAIRIGEPILHTSRRDRPSFRRLMTGDARPAVGAALLEERVLRIQDALVERLALA